MTVQTAPLRRTTSRDALEKDDWEARVHLMEAAARRALRTVRGIREATVRVDGGEGRPVLRGRVCVTSADQLTSMVEYVTCDVVRMLEDLQGRRFDRLDLDFTIASKRGGDESSQILTIT